MEKIKNFVKKEIVFVIAAALAVVSSFFVPISAAYIEYIDFKVIALLFCLMSVIKGFMHTGLFDVMANKIMNTFRTPRSLALALILMTFFSAMLVTNDVALIAFVPLCIGLYEKTDEKSLVFVVVMQTIAANLGSMLTPIGNPQNLFIYSYYEMAMGEFFGVTAPLTLLSLVLISIAVFMKKLPQCRTESENVSVHKSVWLYVILFALSLATVMRVLDYRICFVITLVAMLVINKKLLLQVDYALLGTFVAFFIFVGNISSLEAVRNAISSLVNGRELIMSVLFSQGISNVPCAALLAGFTENAHALLKGVNIGGLGTIVASLASLISFKLYSQHKNADKGAFMKVFTLYNAAFLVILVAFAMI
ncbi:MAG: anion permease [Clostridia bacterium]|nr:anion permease [Clostridia bacterium]